MDRSKLARFGGIVVGFFFLGQALRHLVAGAFGVAGIEVVLAGVVLAAALQVEV